MAANTKQKEYQRNYDKKTKMISVKYALHEMDDYNRLMNYIERTGKSANGFIKELINDFFEQKKYVMDDSRIAEYFTDYEVSGELLDKLEKTVGTAKYDLIIFIHADDPMVADCDSMCIFAEIVNNRLCAIESFFAVRNPVLFITGIQQFLKGIVVAEFFTASMKLQLFLFPQVFQFSQIFATKQF